MTEEHENREAEKDAFELSDDEFDKALESATEADEEVSEPEGDKAGEEASKEPEKKAPADSGQKAEELIEIVHNGISHKVTKAKAIELAQKGFDYEFKVGPHQRLVQLIQQDKDAQEVLNKHFRKKFGMDKPEVPEFKLKSIKDYESADDWFRDNMEGLLKHHAQNRPKPAPVNPNQARQQGVQRVAQMLVQRDPVNAQKVMARMDEFASKLTVQRYSEISRDTAKFLQWYDEIRDQVVAEEKPKETPKKQPSFRVKSGGGDRGTDPEKTNVWEMPRKDFAAMIAKAKGG